MSFEALRERSRRDFLRSSCCGFGTLSLLSLLQQDQLRAAVDPLGPKPPHQPTAKAKSVIFLFMAGGPSHLESFDPKPLLNELDGKRRPKSFGDADYQFVEKDARLLGSFCRSASMARAESKCRIYSRTSLDVSTTSRWCVRATAIGWFILRRSTNSSRGGSFLVFQAWGLGWSTGSARKARVCPPTWSCPIPTVRSKRASRCTPMGSSRRCINPPCSATALTRYAISHFRQVFVFRSAARPSISFAS